MYIINIKKSFSLSHIFNTILQTTFSREFPFKKPRLIVNNCVFVMCLDIIFSTFKTCATSAVVVGHIYISLTQLKRPHPIHSSEPDEVNKCFKVFFSFYLNPLRTQQRIVLAAYQNSLWPLSRFCNFPFVTCLLLLPSDHKIAFSFTTLPQFQCRLDCCASTVNHMISCQSIMHSYDFYHSAMNQQIYMRLVRELY